MEVGPDAFFGRFWAKTAFGKSSLKLFLTVRNLTYFFGQKSAEGDRCVDSVDGHWARSLEARLPLKKGPDVLDFNGCTKAVPF